MISAHRLFGYALIALFALIFSPPSIALESVYATGCYQGNCFNAASPAGVCDQACPYRTTGTCYGSYDGPWPKSVPSTQLCYMSLNPSSTYGSISTTTVGCSAGMVYDPVAGCISPSSCPDAGTFLYDGALDTGGEFVAHDMSGCEFACAGSGLGLTDLVTCRWEYTGNEASTGPANPGTGDSGCVSSSTGTQLCVGDPSPPGCGTVNGAQLCASDLPGGGCYTLSNGQKICDGDVGAPPAPDNDGNGVPDNPGGGTVVINNGGGDKTYNIYNNNQHTTVNEDDDPAPTVDQDSSLQELVDAIASLNQQLADLEAANDDNAAVVAALKTIGQQLGALGQLVASIDPSADLAKLDASIKAGNEQLAGIKDAVGELGEAGTPLGDALAGIQGALDGISDALGGDGEDVDCGAGYSAHGTTCVLDTAFAGGECGSPLTCTGDPIQCAMVQAVHDSKCAATEVDDSGTTATAVSTELHSEGGVYDVATDDSLIQLSEGCPAPIVVDWNGRQESYDLQVVCDAAAYMRPVIIALASWRAGILVLRGF